MSDLQFSMNGRAYAVAIIARRPHLVVEIDGRRLTVREPADGLLQIDGQAMALERAMDGDIAHVRLAGRTAAVSYVDPAMAAGDEALHAGDVIAAMPGTVGASSCRRRRHGCRRRCHCHHRKHEAAIAPNGVS